MAQERSAHRVLLPVPPTAAVEWAELCRVLDIVGPVPCQTGEAEGWWPDGHTSRAPRAERAVALCRRCTAAHACLSYALAADERFGIWGGTLPEERRAIRWRRR